MLISKNYLGSIYISKKYIKSLVKTTIKSCFGIAGFYNYNTKLTLLNKILNKKSIRIKFNNKNNTIDLYIHVLAVYGSNISEVVKNIKSMLSSNIFNHTGIHVNSVNVFVDSIKK